MLIGPKRYAITGSHLAAATTTNAIHASSRVSQKKRQQEADTSDRDSLLNQGFDLFLAAGTQQLMLLRPLVLLALHHLHTPRHVMPRHSSAQMQQLHPHCSVTTSADQQLNQALCSIIDVCADNSFSILNSAQRPNFAVAGGGKGAADVATTMQAFLTGIACEFAPFQESTFWPFEPATGPA